MAKFNIEVNLDWLEEDQNIDEILKEEVISGLRSTIINKAQKEIESKLADVIEDESKIIVSQFLGKTFENKIETMQLPVKSSSWDSKVEYISLSEFVGREYEKHLNKKVFDYEGRIPSYERDAKVSITEYFVKNYLEKELTKKVEKLIQNARKDAEETIVKTLEQTLKNQLSIDIIRRLNIPEMLNNLQEKAALLDKNES